MKECTGNHEKIKGFNSINSSDKCVDVVGFLGTGKKRGKKRIPLPGFREWLDPVLLEGDESILTPAEIKTLKSISGRFNDLRDRQD